MITNYSDLEKTLKIKFKNTALIEKAFIHRSYLNEAKNQSLTSNERLEFLGDSILSFVISQNLYQKFPKFPEGDLTNYRSSLVCAKTLSLIAKKLNLGSFLKMSRGEKESGGITNLSLLANTIESLIGAIFLDQGLLAVKDFIDRFVFNQLDEIIKNKSFKDYKSLLQEIVQEKVKDSPLYQVLKSWGPDHAKSFQIGVFVNEELIGEGTGKSKQIAEQEAAKQGIEKWRKIR